MSHGHWVRYALLTAALWGVWGACTGLPSEHGVPDTLTYGVWALTMRAPAVWVMRRSGARLQRDRRSVFLGLAIGLLGAGGQMLLFRALTSGPPYLIFPIDRKSTRLNSSHSQISYAVFCLKKKNSTSVDSSPSLASTWSTSRPSYVTASC